MTWIETKPESTDPLFELPSVLTQNAIALRTGLEKFSFWTDSSGLSAGIPRLSAASFGPGAARAFYDVESSLSTAFSTTKPMAGRFYLASNVGRLYGFTGTATLQLGGANVIVWQPSAATIQSNTRVLCQTGSVNSVSGGAGRMPVTFPSQYSVAPTVQATVLSLGTTDLIDATVTSITTSGCSIGFQALMTSASATSHTVLWRSIGTVAL